MQPHTRLISSLITDLILDEAGQDLIEYSLLASFMVLVTVAGATALGTALNNWYQATSGSVNVHAASAS
jgi:Flp pilus assembly pilin Flp